MAMTVMNDNSITRAKLDDGRIVHYMMCCDVNKKLSNPEPWIYLGTGIIYDVNGTVQSGTQRHDFYTKNTGYKPPKEIRFNRYTALID